MDDLSPKTRELIADVEAALPSQKTPEFERVWERLLYAQACTSLSNDEATERMNELPPGTSNGRWELITEGENAPVSCADKPDTHRHLLFEC